MQAEQVAVLAGTRVAATPERLGLPKSHPGWRRCRDGLSSLRDDRPVEAARRIAPRTVQIACGSRSRVGISPPRKRPNRHPYPPKMVWRVPRWGLDTVAERDG